MDRAISQALLAMLPRLRRFAYGLTGSADEGDDLVQATVERAIRHIDRFEPGTRLDSWLYRIARNLNLNRLRGLRVRGEAVDPDEAGLASGGEHDAIARLTFARLQAALARLPEDQRAALLLVTVEGLSYQEAASALDLPIGTLTSRLARARLALHAMLDGERREKAATR